MRKKLVLFGFALLTLGVLLTAPVRVAAYPPWCPTTCPIPDWPNWEEYCYQECSGYSNPSYCLQECYDTMETEIEYLYTNCGVC